MLHRAANDDHEAGRMAHAAYLTNWRYNRERLEKLAGLVTALESAGIRSMALKGAALTLRYYQDSGVRTMRDIDLLVEASHLPAAVDTLQNLGYIASEGYATADVLRRSRLVHAWEFSENGSHHCDLHWRPLVRCFSPELDRIFWDEADLVQWHGHRFLVPCPTDQLFHTCVHGLQWDWVPHIRWVADAQAILLHPIQWTRIARLAAAASMNHRLAEALQYLRDRFAAPIPEDLLVRLRKASTRWERDEYELLLKPCPLGVMDSVSWHLYHFRRIRAYDPEWRRTWYPISFTRYLAAFLDADGRSEFLQKAKRELQARRKPRSAGQIANDQNGSRNRDLKQRWYALGRNLTGRLRKAHDASVAGEVEQAAEADPLTGETCEIAENVSAHTTNQPHEANAGMSSQGPGTTMQSVPAVLWRCAWTERIQARGSQPFFVCLMPVWNHRHETIENAMQCFLDQRYPFRALLVVDDRPANARLADMNSTALLEAGIFYVSLPERAKTLPDKYNQGLREVLVDGSPIPTHVAIWDDDDGFTPRHLELAAAEYAKNPAIMWTYPDTVLTTYGEQLHTQPSGGRFWSSITFDLRCIADGEGGYGFPVTKAVGQDVLFLRMLRAKHGQPGKPAVPTYIYRWGREREHHTSAVSTGFYCERWWEATPHSISNGLFLPKYDTFYLETLQDLETGFPESMRP
jgi:hypothetical protein